MEDKEYIELYDEGHEFTDDEIDDWVLSSEWVVNQHGEVGWKNHRHEVVIKDSGRHFKTSRYEGNKDRRDDEPWEQPVEVRMRFKTVSLTTVEWEEVVRP